jgi:hypothetical protein
VNEGWWAGQWRICAGGGKAAMTWSSGADSAGLAQPERLGLLPLGSSSPAGPGASLQRRQPLA